MTSKHCRKVDGWAPTITSSARRMILRRLKDPRNPASTKKLLTSPERTLPGTARPRASLLDRLPLNPWVARSRNSRRSGASIPAATSAVTVAAEKPRPLKRLFVWRHSISSGGGPPPGRGPASRVTSCQTLSFPTFVMQTLISCGP
jgi:hypothetical protein